MINLFILEPGSVELATRISAPQMFATLLDRFNKVINNKCPRVFNEDYIKLNNIQ